MQIFVISLKDSKNRRKQIKIQMEKFGLKFKFFDAVDARKSVPKKYINKIDYKLIRYNLGRDMTTGEIGCALSHALLYEKLIDENITEAIIIEDDGILSKDFAELVKSETLQKSSFDMIMLHHFKCRIIENKLMAFIGKYRIGGIVNQPCCAPAYYINNKIINKLYNATQKIGYLSDFPIDLSNGDVGAVVPRIVMHPKVQDSSLESDRNKIEKRKYRKKIFGRFGFISWLKYKIKKPKSIKVSEKIEGK